MRQLTSLALLSTCLLAATACAENLVVTFTAEVDSVIQGSVFTTGISEGDRIFGTITWNLDSLPVPTTYGAFPELTRYDYLPGQSGLIVSLSVEGGSAFEWSSASAGHSGRYLIGVSFNDSSTSDSSYARDSVTFQLSDPAGNESIGIGFGDMDTPWDFFTGTLDPHGWDTNQITLGEIGYFFDFEASSQHGLVATVITSSFSITSIPEAHAAAMACGWCAAIVTLFRRRRVHPQF